MPTGISPRTLLITVLTSAVLLFIYTTLPSFSFSPMSYSSSSVNNISGYLTRGTPLSPSTPLSRDKLKLAVLRNAPVETDGFTLALFDEDIAVTHSGAIIRLQPEDFAGLLNLAAQTITLPTPESFYNAWVIDQPRTSHPIDRILIPLGILGTPKERYQDEFREVSVRGFEEGRWGLKERVEGYDELPEVLRVLVGLVLEARNMEEEVDESVVGKVKALLGNVY